MVTRSETVCVGELIACLLWIGEWESCSSTHKQLQSRTRGSLHVEARVPPVWIQRELLIETWVLNTEITYCGATIVVSGHCESRYRYCAVYANDIDVYLGFLMEPSKFMEAPGILIAHPTTARVP